MLFSLLTCREALEQLDDYIDRELSPRDIPLVQRHLKICRHCAQKFGAEAEFIGEMRSRLERIQAPEGLLADIGNALSAAAGPSED